MEFIGQSAEHFLLKYLDQFKDKPVHCTGLYFSLSKNVSHEKLVKDLPNINDTIQSAKARGDVFAQELFKALEDFKGHVCVFKDTDILALVEIVDKADQQKVAEVFNVMMKKLPKDLGDMDSVNDKFLTYQKLADKKLLSARCFDAYVVMGDENKVESIKALRKRRDAPLVMMVEDDRFTSTYAATILGTDFDLLIAKDGEEAIEAYIKNAPDIVFLDIHLPGLSGHDVLKALHAIDPEAFIVMLSADTVKENIVEATQHGARKFLKKPFTKERLIETVRNSPYVRSLMTAKSAAKSEESLH